MPRKPRHSEPGTVYHLISRFVDRAWFIEDEQDRSYYLHLLGRALEQSDWSALSYAVMSSHFHHGVVAGEQPLDEWIRRVHSPFADWLNKKYGRIGTIFVRGPKQLAVQPTGIARLLAYIHNNPVRAGVVADASLSTWTSHRAYLGLAPVPSWLHVEAGLHLAGLNDGKTLTDLVRLQQTDPSRDRVRDKLLIEDPEAREAFHRERVVQAIDVEEVINATAETLCIDSSALRSRRRTSGHVFARHVLMSSADQLGVSGVTIARALGLSQQGVSFTLCKTPDPAVADAASRIIARLKQKAG